MNAVQQASIPGVRCGKCLGRISDEDNDFSREAQAKVYPGREWRPPCMCGPCIVETILSWPDGPEEEEAEHG
jgi:hypothetical protein